MTEEAIQRHLDAIKRFTNEALESKESARQLLVDAGIIKVHTGSKSEPQKPTTNPSK